jgi:hypothetical protein
MKTFSRFEIAAWIFVVVGIGLAVWRPLWLKPPNLVYTPLIYDVLGLVAALTGVGLFLRLASQAGRAALIASLVLLPVLTCLVLTLIGPLIGAASFAANQGKCAPVRLPNDLPGLRCGPAPAPADEGGGPLITDTFIDLAPLPLLWFVDRQVQP